MTAIQQGATVEILIKTTVNAAQNRIFYPELLRMEYIKMVINASPDFDKRPIIKHDDKEPIYKINGHPLPLNKGTRAFAIFKYLAEECKTGRWHTKDEIEQAIREDMKLVTVTGIAARMKEMEERLNRLSSIAGAILLSKKRSGTNKLEYKLNAKIEAETEFS